MQPQPTSKNPASPTTTALMCLTFVARYHEIRIDAKKLLFDLDLENIDLGLEHIVKACNISGMKSKIITTSATNISKYPLPLITKLPNGKCIAVVKYSSEGLIIFDPTTPDTPISVPMEKFHHIFDGKVVIVAKGKEKTKAAVEKFGFNFFFDVMYRYRSIFIEILVASFIVQLMGLASPLLTQLIVDKVVVHKNISTLYVLGMGMIFVIMFEIVLGSIRSYLMAHTATKIDSIISARVFKHLLQLPLNFFESRRIGSNISHFHEIENIRNFITGGGIGTIIDTLFTFIFIIAMFYYSVTLTIITLITIPVLAIITITTTSVIRKQIEQKNDLGAANHVFLVEALSGIHTIKALSLEQIFLKRWQIQFSNYCGSSFRMAKFGLVTGSITQLVQRLSTLSILCFGAYEVIQGRLSVGQLIAFQMLSARSIQPMMRIVQIWQQLQQISLSITRLADIMDFKREEVSTRHSIGREVTVGNVQFKNVSFRYAGRGINAVSNISIMASTGDIVAIVGKSGSGKSTIGKLIQGLYHAQEGSVLINGIDVKSWDTRQLRRNIGVVLQDSFLFEGTIASNIKIHRPLASDEEIIESSKLVGAHEFIMNLPLGYETSVGERGEALSGGQRQRIAIARALIGDPQILVFDEATSALDTESESDIIENLTTMATGRTVFIITHKLKSIRAANKIAVFDQGLLIEAGTHQELMKKNGTYFKLSRGKLDRDE